jgi:hypothetical protein
MHARRRSLARCTSDGEYVLCGVTAVTAVTEVVVAAAFAVRVLGGKELLPGVLSLTHYPC